MRVLSPPTRPIPFALHRLCRTDPRRVAAVAARYDEGLLPVVPASPPRLRAGKRGKSVLTPYQRKQQARALTAGRPTLRQRLRATLARVLGGPDA